MLTKVSIIIASYNAEDYLEKCLLSCIRQTYSEIEILVIDDGSSDKSAVIANEMGKIDHRIRTVVKKNEGLVKTRKVGFNISEGDYIFFLDCDDYIELNAIETLVLNASENNSDLIIGGSLYEDESGNPITSWISSFNGTSRTEYLKSFFMSDIQPNIWGRLISKDKYKIVDVPDHYTGGEDIIANTMLICKNETIKITTTEEVLYHYLVRKKSLTNTFAPEEFLDFTKEIEKILLDSGLEKEVFDEWSQFMIKVAWRRYLRKGGRYYLKDKAYVDHIYQKYYNHTKGNLSISEKTELILYRFNPTAGRYFSRIFSRLNLIK